MQICVVCWKKFTFQTIKSGTLNNIQGTFILITKIKVNILLTISLKTMHFITSAADDF